MLEIRDRKKGVSRMWSKEKSMGLNNWESRTLK